MFKNRKIKELEREIEQIKKRLDSLEPQKVESKQVPIVKVVTYHPNQPNPRSAVSFQLLSSDWLKLEQSKDWKKVLRRLKKYQIRYSRMYPKEISCNEDTSQELKVNSRKFGETVKRVIREEGDHMGLRYRVWQVGGRNDDIKEDLLVRCETEEVAQMWIVDCDWRCLMNRTIRYIRCCEVKI